MYFYYFLCNFPSGFTAFTFFSASYVSSVGSLGRPSRSSNLVPRLAVVGGVLLAILADCSSRKQKILRL